MHPDVHSPSGSFINRFVNNFSDVGTGRFKIHAVVVCVSEKFDRLLVLGRTYVSIAALKPLERKILKSEDSD